MRFLEKFMQIGHSRSQFQQLDTELRSASSPFSAFPGGNVRQQNDAFESINNMGQLALPTKYNGQPNSFNTQLSTGQMFNDRSNTMHIDNAGDQQKSNYDQSNINASSYGDIISKQPNYHTPQSGIDIYLQ